VKTPEALFGLMPILLRFVGILLHFTPDPKNLIPPSVIENGATDGSAVQQNEPATPILLFSRMPASRML
jgi:hypothetical protein